MSRVLISRFPGKCRDCGARISRGVTIVYHGTGRGISCLSCDGKEHGDDTLEYNEDECAGLEPGTLASDRRLARQGLTVVRTSSGWVGTQNSRGRCEDAPCCGCCTF